MTGKQFANLEVGDMCMVIRGHDAGRYCQVAYIEGESVVVRSLDGKRFWSMNQYDRLKLTSYRELRLLGKEPLFRALLFFSSGDLRRP